MVDRHEVNELPIRCFCGEVRGVAREVSGDRINRVVCYCGGCQSYAHFLGCADEMLDEHGGTDIFQMSPRHVEITAGNEHVACVHLTPKGALRWYAACCNTPIGNTLSTSQVPFLGMVHACIDIADKPRSLGAALGRVRARVNGDAARGDPATRPAFDRAPVSMLLRFAGKLLTWRLRGDHKRSPFFDPQTGEPIVTPRELSADELRAVETARDSR